MSEQDSQNAARNNKRLPEAIKSKLRGATFLVVPEK